MMNNKDLSKCKHIYRLYLSDDGSVHIEKYPIIYINKRYVYFKAGGDALRIAEIRYVSDSANLKLKELNFSPYTHDLGYFWSVEGVDSGFKVDLLKLKRDAEIRSLKAQIEYTTQQADAHRRHQLSYIEETCKLKAKLKKLEEESNE